MESKKIRTVVYGAVGLLAVVLLIIVAYVLFLNNQTPTFVPTQNVSIGGVSQTDASSPFNAAVLERSDYRNLNKSLMNDNKVPVNVPENRGKPNLFGI